MPLIRSAVLLALLAAATNVWAARPMVTDDARIVDPKACQVESWVRHDRHGSHEFWAVPSCNLTRWRRCDAPRGLRANRRSHAAVTRRHAVTRSRARSGCGWRHRGCPAQARVRPNATRSRPNPSHGCVAVAARSWPAPTNPPGALCPLAAAGCRRRRSRSYRGLASELLLRDRVQLISEVYGESGSRPLVHAGLRYWLIPDRVQIDTTVGAQTRFGSGGRWFTIGVRVLSPAFLP